MSLSDTPTRYEGVKVEAQRGILFETPVVQAHFSNCDTMLEDLEHAIRIRKQDDPDGVARSNVGGWHSDTDMLGWGGDAARLLADRAISIAKRLSSFAGASHEDFDWLVQMWANVSGPGALNHMHVHPGNLWSAVLYIDMGGEGPQGDDIQASGGNFYFEDPRFPMSVMHNTRFRFAGPDGQPQPMQPEVAPKRGDLLMFPSWLRHGVRPYKGTRQRISIALNVDAVPR